MGKALNSVLCFYGVICPCIGLYVILQVMIGLIFFLWNVESVLIKTHLLAHLSYAQDELLGYLNICCHVSSTISVV